MTGLGGQTRGEAGVEPRDGEVALVAAFVGGKRINRHAEQTALTADGVKKSFVHGPHTGEAAGLDGDAFLGAGVAHHRHAERRLGQGVRLDSGPIGIGREEGHAGAQPGGGHALGMQHHHAAGPMSAAAVTPERPWHGG